MVGFDPIQGLFQLGTAAITAGGTVAGAYLTSSAQEDIAKANAKAALQAQIAQAQANLAGQQQTAATVQGVASTLTSWPVLLFGLAAVYLATRRA